MIGVFDSGSGGLTVLRALVQRFPAHRFRYLGDHAHMPYGDRPADEIVRLTRDGVERLFGMGCRLVMLGCNTATAVAARRLQTEWLVASGWRARGHNVLGIVAPTVEAATQTPWAVTAPQYPQKYNTDVIAVFGTRRTVLSGVFVEEIRKRCPKVRVVQRACPGLADAIEDRRPEAELEAIVKHAVLSALEEIGGPPHRAILGCTHYPLVEPVFQRHLPAFTRVLAQPDVVADSLEDYLARHAHYAAPARPDTSRADDPLSVRLFTTGELAAANGAAGIFWPSAPAFEPV
jgi:glutamate racemase